MRQCLSPSRDISGPSSRRGRSRGWTFWDNGDDPNVEPGETAIRAFVDRAGHCAEGFEDDEKVLQAFEQAHRQTTKKLDRAGLLPSVAWVHFIPDTPGGGLSATPCTASRA
jgi:hypothetical protein